MRLLGRAHEPHTHDFTHEDAGRHLDYRTQHCGSVLVGSCSTYDPVSPGDYFLLPRDDGQTRYRVRMCEWHVEPPTLNYVVLDFAPR